MPTAKKADAIEALKRRLEGAQNLFLTDYSGLSVAEITKLREQLRKDGNGFTVVKNTLFSRAAGKDLAAQLESFLAGPTGIVFAGNDPVAPAKALKTFSTETKPVTVKVAYIDGQIVGPAEIAVLAALPPKAELLTRMVGSLVSPIRGLFTVLKGNQSGLVRALNAIREKKLAESAS